MCYSSGQPCPVAPRGTSRQPVVRHRDGAVRRLGRASSRRAARGRGRRHRRVRTNHRLRRPPPGPSAGRERRHRWSGRSAPFLPLWRRGAAPSAARANAACATEAPTPGTHLPARARRARGNARWSRRRFEATRRMVSCQLLGELHLLEKESSSQVSTVWEVPIQRRLPDLRAPRDLVHRNIGTVREQLPRRSQDCLPVTLGVLTPRGLIGRRHPGQCSAEDPVRKREQ